MSIAIKSTASTPMSQQDITNAANDHAPAGAVAIAAMRNMLGRSSAASQYDKLAPQQKAMILFAARLKPSEFINKPLLTLSLADRDAVRKSIIALTDLANAFGSLSLARDQFLSQPKPRRVKSLPHAQQNKSDVDSAMEDVSELARALALEVEEVKQ